MGHAVFPHAPDSRAVRAVLGQAIRQAGAAPKYLVCDKGGQFWCDGFKRWAERRGIRLRFGAVGKHGSIAVVERFNGTLKRDGMRRMQVPLRTGSFRRELRRFIEWYNEHRPNMALGGCTPNEVYYRLPPKNRRPRIEPRQRWPRGSKCAAPQTLVAGQPGARFEVDVRFVAKRRHLPVVRLKRVA